MSFTTTMIMIPSFSIEFVSELGFNLETSDILLKTLLPKIKYHKFRLNSDTKFDTNPPVDDLNFKISLNSLVLCMEVFNRSISLHL